MCKHTSNYMTSQKQKQKKPKASFILHDLAVDVVRLGAGNHCALHYNVSNLAIFFEK